MTSRRHHVMLACFATSCCVLLSVLCAGTSLQAQQLEQVEASPHVTWIGSVTTEGDAVLNADQARFKYGIDGSGVNLSVISDTFDATGSSPTVANQIANGDLPGPGNPNGYITPVAVLNDAASGTDEGRAMLEIVHDVAPGASLYFHSAFNNTAGPAPSQTIADAIGASALAVGAGGIVVDDVGFLTQARFQDGAAAQAVDAAYAAGVSYFSSAGNSADRATRTSWDQAVDGNTVDWGSGDVLQLQIPSGIHRLVVQWTDPYNSVSGPHTVTDFSVDVTTPDGLTTYFTVNGQTGTGSDPYEFVGINNGGGTVDIGLRLNYLGGGTSLDIVQVSVYDSLVITDPNNTNSPTIHGHAAAAGAQAIAAHYWSSSPSFFGGTLTSVESFSSHGPTEIFFDTNGNPISETRQTPQLAAPDGVSTTTAGFTTFFGTSAAAPHAAAVAALMQEHSNNLYGSAMTPADIYNVLQQTAVDIESPGFDNLSGYGRIDALAALDGITPEMLVTAWGGTGAAADFGMIRIGTSSAAQSAEVENIGGAFSTLNGAFGTASGEFSGGGGSFSLADGETDDASYTFTPVTHGLSTQPLAITSNAFMTPTIVNSTANLSLEGMGVGPIFDSNQGTGTGGTINFGTVLIGDTATVTFDLMNITTDPNGGDSTLTDLTVFDVLSTDPQFAVTGFTTNSVIEAGDLLSFSLEFSPSSTGSFSDLLTILSDQDAAFGSTGTSFLFSLQGVGFIPEPGTFALLLVAASLTLSRSFRRR